MSYLWNHTLKWNKNYIRIVFFSNYATSTIDILHIVSLCDYKIIKFIFQSLILIIFFFQNISQILHLAFDWITVRKKCNVFTSNIYLNTAFYTNSQVCFTFFVAFHTAVVRYDVLIRLIKIFSILLYICTSPDLCGSDYCCLFVCVYNWLESR